MWVLGVVANGYIFSLNRYFQTWEDTQKHFVIARFNVLIDYETIVRDFL